MNCLAALYVTFAYCHVNLEIKVTRMHKNSEWKGVVSINLMLPITCTGAFVVWAVEFSGRVLLLPRVSFESEAETCLEGQTLAPSGREVAKTGQTAVNCTGIRWDGFVACAWCWWSSEWLADVIMQPAAVQTGSWKPGPRLWGGSDPAGARGELLTAACQWRMCRAGSSNVITGFAFLVLSVSQLVARDGRSQWIFLGEHPCFVLEWTRDLWPVTGWCSAFL